MTRPTRILVTHRSSHHGAWSGHAGGAHLFGADCIVDGTGPSVSYVVAHAASRVSADRAYGSLGVQREVEALRTGRARGGRASVHFLAAEHDVNHLPRIAHRLGWHTSAWFHKPPDELGEILDRRRGLRRLDMAWAVSRTQVPLLEERFGAERVSLLRHGVDTARFSPPRAVDRSRRVLFVGVHRRDFAQLGRVYDRLARLDPSIERRIIVPGNAAQEVIDLPHDVRLDATDEQLLAELRTAGVVFLPLLDCTANNSLLESLATGTPVVATDLSGVSEYAGDAAVLVPPGDDAAAVEAIRRVLDDPDEARTRQQASRARSLEFDWAKAAESFRWVGDRPVGEPATIALPTR